MTTAAQIDANRRNALKSKGPKTDEGKNRSKLNALVHGCRANMLVLPTEDPGLYDDRSRSWRMSLKPRNPAEEYIVDRMASLAWKSDRIDRAQTAQLNKRVRHAGLDAADAELEQVIALGNQLLRDIHSVRTGHSQIEAGHLGANVKAKSASAVHIVADDPMVLVLRLQTTKTGCQWMLDQWDNLRTILERDLPWVAADQLTAVRLLGHNPIDAFNNVDIARLYLASHLLLNQGGEPFQDIINELPPCDAPRYRQSLQMRQYDVLAPQDVAAARQALFEIVDLATEQLQTKLEALSPIVERDAASAADRALWDDSVEGERLRRYEMNCRRSWMRMYELLVKTRTAGKELNFAAIAALDRSVVARTKGANDSPEQAATNVITAPVEPVNEPDPPIEANPVRGNAPNKPNSDIQAPSSTRRDDGKDFRIDTPHLGRNAGTVGITGKATMHPALRRLQTGRESTLLDLSSIFDGH